MTILRPMCLHEELKPLVADCRQIPACILCANSISSLNQGCRVYSRYISLSKRRLWASGRINTPNRKKKKNISSVCNFAVSVLIVCWTFLVSLLRRYTEFSNVIDLLLTSIVRSWKFLELRFPALSYSSFIWEQAGPTVVVFVVVAWVLLQSTKWIQV